MHSTARIFPDEALRTLPTPHFVALGVNLFRISCYIMCMWFSRRRRSPSAQHLPGPRYGQEGGPAGWYKYCSLELCGVGDARGVLPSPSRTTAQRAGHPPLPHPPHAHCPRRPTAPSNSSSSSSSRFRMHPALRPRRVGAHGRVQRGDAGAIEIVLASCMPFKRY
jgi:hypothetical protein